MKKLELSQMMCVLGGYRASECKAVQALAAELSEKMATDESGMNGVSFTINTVNMYDRN